MCYGYESTTKAFSNFGQYQIAMEHKDAFRLLRSIMAQDRKKPVGFNHGHLLLSVIFLGRKEVTPRSEMKSSLGLGTGSIRSLMGRLVLNHVAIASATGFRLGPFGHEILASIMNVLLGPFPISVEYLGLDRKQALYILRRIEVSAVNPIRLRDLVVRYGGTGATTCLLDKGRIQIIGIGEWLADFSSKDEKEILGHTSEQGDIVIVVSAPSEAVSASSGAAAVFDLLESILQ